MVPARSPADHPSRENTQVAGKSPQGFLLKPAGHFSRAFRRAFCRNKHAEWDIPYWQKRAENGINSGLQAQGAKQTQLLAIKALAKSEVILNSKLILVQLRQSVVVSPTLYSESYCMVQKCEMFLWLAVAKYSFEYMLITEVKSKWMNWRKISQIQNLKFITILLFHYFI